MRSIIAAVTKVASVYGMLELRHSYRNSTLKLEIFMVGPFARRYMPIETGHLQFSAETRTVPSETTSSGTVTYLRRIVGGQQGYWDQQSLVWNASGSGKTPDEIASNVS